LTLSTFKKCILVSLLLLTSCTSMRLEDFFKSYVDQMKPAKQAAENGMFEQALSLVPVQNSNHNAYNLSLLEKGRIAFLQKNWSQSQKLFTQAYNEIAQESAKAKIQISSSFQNAGAIVSNDSAITYKIPAFEQSMMHSYQALNYLYQGSLESALVEIRRANLVQEHALRNNENEIISLQDKMTANGVSLDSLSSRYPSMKNLIGEAKNGFQNAYTFYLSAILYEASGELNDAYIDYKKALEIFPDNYYLQKDVIRLAKKLDIDDITIPYLSKAVSKKTEEKGLNNTGQLVVIYEQNLIIAKQEQKLDLPIFTRHDDLRFFSFSLPIFQESGDRVRSLKLNYLGQDYQSEKIVNLKALASKNLQDSLPSMVTRQVLRILAKEQMRRKMKSEGGDIGNVLASLYNLASERADTRSWLMLPGHIEVMKIDLPEGTHSLQLEHRNGYSNIDVVIKKGRMSLVNVVALENFTAHKTINL